jgi:hypothetical protein
MAETSGQKGTDAELHPLRGNLAEFRMVSHRDRSRMRHDGGHGRRA